MDFVPILRTLIDKKIVTLKKGTTIEGLLELPEVDENNPLELSEEDISFKGNRIFLSETARDKINGLLFKKNLDIETLVSKNDLNEDTLRRFLKGTGIPKNSFLKILNLLADQGVLKEPETSFEALLVYDLVPNNFTITRPIHGETRILLKQDPANAIQARLMANRLTQKSIAAEAGFRSVLMVNNLLCDQTIDPKNLKKILRVLLDHQIITLPEGSNVDGFVAGVAAMEPSFPRTSATAAGCASAGSNNNAPIALAAALEAQGQSAGS